MKSVFNCAVLHCNLHLYIKQLSFIALLRPRKHWMHSLLLFELSVFTEGDSDKNIDICIASSLFSCDWALTGHLVREVLVEKVNLKHLKFPPLKQFQQKHNLYEGRFNCGAVVLDCIGF